MQSVTMPKPKAKQDGWVCAFAKCPSEKGIYEVWMQGRAFHAEYDGISWYRERIGVFAPRFWRRVKATSTTEGISAIE